MIAQTMSEMEREYSSSKKITSKTNNKINNIVIPITTKNEYLIAKNGKNNYNFPEIVSNNEENIAELLEEQFGYYSENIVLIGSYVEKGMTLKIYLALDCKQMKDDTNHLILTDYITLCRRFEQGAFNDLHQSLAFLLSEKNFETKNAIEKQKQKNN